MIELRAIPADIIYGATHAAWIDGSAWVLEKSPAGIYRLKLAVVAAGELVEPAVPVNWDIATWGDIHDFLSNLEKLPPSSAHWMNQYEAAAEVDSDLDVLTYYGEYTRWMRQSVYEVEEGK